MASLIRQVASVSEPRGVTSKELAKVGAALQKQQGRRAFLGGVGAAASAALGGPLPVVWAGPAAAQQVALPPGASVMHLAVPAFWNVTQQYDHLWKGVVDAGSAVSIVVVGDSTWPSTAAANPTWKAQALNRLQTLPGAVLGYVYARDGNGNLLPPAEILSGPSKQDSVQAWYAQFGQDLDGVYFDELVMPNDPGSVAAATTLLAQFRQQFPAAKSMFLAGQCIDQAVVGPNTDWVLMWESREEPYREDFLSSVAGVDPQVPNRRIPAWWKDPDNRSKIVHVVHNCQEHERQHALQLAKERNAGHVFVMDRRGLRDPSNPNTDDLYDHLPPYWDVEVREVGSYYDFGFDPLRALRAAHLHAKASGAAHGWPNFEQAWVGGEHRRGTFLLSPTAGVSEVVVPVANLLDPYPPRPDRPPNQQPEPPAPPAPFDIPAMWRAAHNYARAQGAETGMPTFEFSQTSGGQGVRITLLAQGLPWLVRLAVPVRETYQRPTFAEPGAVIRNANRWVTSRPNNPYMGSFTTFMPQSPFQPRGVDPRANSADNYDCYAIRSTAQTGAVPVVWADVPTSTYIQRL